MPRGYDVHDERIEVFLPLTIDPKTFPNSRGSHFLYLDRTPEGRRVARSRRRRISTR